MSDKPQTFKIMMPCCLVVPFRNGIIDPVNRLWDLYKRHNKGGLLRIKAFTLELVGTKENVL